MNSSLLPNDIQDIDGLELKEQVKVLKDYIEYMREQLQWFSSVTDKNEEGFVQSVTTYYGVSSSPSVPPSEWSTEPPEVEEGEYLWQYTKITRSGTTTRSEPVCISASMASGEDAALIYIHSSNGTVFRPGNNGTTLTITVYYGSDAIRTLANLQTAFGSGAHLAWYKREYGSDSYVPVSSSKISDNGFTVTLTSDDVDTRATYNCRLMLSETITRSQSSVTITDIEDGYTATLSQDSITWNGNDTNLGANKTVSFTISGFCGVDTAPFTIGTPVLSDPSHASASVSGSTVTLTVSSTATAGGTVTLPVAFTDGPTLHSTFAYFVLLKGAQGIQGDQGDQGIQGPAGPDGRTTYVHIKYSHIANPQTSADISDIPDDYIGICTNYTSSDPTDPAAYVPWTRFKGQDGPQGIPGATGEDGTTYYVHFAYATSDTGADFSLTPFEGATYIGVCTDTEIDDPTTPASYTWSLTKGEKGDAGYNAATIFLYQRKSSVPNKQAGTLTYTFATKALTGTLDNGWSTSIPSGTNPLYVIIATASSNTATDTIVSADWSSPVVLAQDGGTGAGISSVTEVYFAKANTTAPAAPSSTVTTNDPTVYNAWNKALPTYSASYPYYFTCSEVLLSNGTRVWSTPVYAGALTTANQTAASANTTAAAAQSTANTANSTANVAQTTANTANTTANTAKNTADTAKTTADTAKTTADAAKDEIDNLEIGGRNLLLGTGGSNIFLVKTADMSYSYGTNMNPSMTSGEMKFVPTSGNGEMYYRFLTPVVGSMHGLTPGGTYTISFWAKGTLTEGTSFNVRSQCQGLTVNWAGGILTTVELSSEYKYFTFTDTLPINATAYYISFQVYADGDVTGTTVYVKRLKFEKGNRATDWTPAPEDFDAAIETVEETATEALNKHGFCSCTTAAGTADKTASLSGFQLKTGSTVHVTFANANTVANPTLNINNTGAKTIRWNNASVTAAASPWAAGECVSFVYDGTYWVISGQSNISADNIVAGSIAADRIKANVISAVNNGTGTINADKVNAAGLTIGQSQVTGLTTALNGKETAGAAASALTSAKAYTDAVEIGGKNLLVGSSNGVGWGYSTFNSTDGCVFTRTTTSTSESYISGKLMKFEPGQIYTLSAYIKKSGPVTTAEIWKVHSSGGGSHQNKTSFQVTDEYKKYTWTFTCNAASEEQAYIRFDNNGSATAGTTAILYVKNPKLEKGNRATDWTPAPEDVDAAIDDAAKTATSYITNISGGGITVTGNSASSKIEIANTVKVIRDSTHFAEMTSSEFKIHAGNATYPVTSIGASTGYFGGDGAGNYLMTITKGYNSLDPSLIGGVLNIRDTNNTSRVTIGAFGQFGIANFNNSEGRTLVEIGGNSSGYGNFTIFNGAATNQRIAELTTMTVYSGSVKLVDNEPTLKFTNSNGTIGSWYSLKRAYINDGTYQGYVVYGNTGQHGIRVDYLTSGRINFYVDTSSIGYATITSSDERMKTDIEPIDDKYKRAVGNIELKNFRFDFNDPTRAGANLLKRFGAIAQDVIKALDDEGINYEENELVETLEDDNGEYYTINYVPFLIARLAADEDRIKELETALERRLA